MRAVHTLLCLVLALSCVHAQPGSACLNMIRARRPFYPELTVMPSISQLRLNPAAQCNNFIPPFVQAGQFRFPQVLQSLSSCNKHADWIFDGIFGEYAGVPLALVPPPVVHNVVPTGGAPGAPNLQNLLWNAAGAAGTGMVAKIGITDGNGGNGGPSLNHWFVLEAPHGLNAAGAVGGAAVFQVRHYQSYVKSYSLHDWLSNGPGGALQDDVPQQGMLFDPAYPPRYFWRAHPRSGRGRLLRGNAATNFMTDLQTLIDGFNNFAAGAPAAWTAPLRLAYQRLFGVDFAVGYALGAPFLQISVRPYTDARCVANSAALNGPLTQARLRVTQETGALTWQSFTARDNEQLVPVNRAIAWAAGQGAAWNRATLSLRVDQTNYGGFLLQLANGYCAPGTVDHRFDFRAAPAAAHFATLRAMTTASAALQVTLLRSVAPHTPSPRELVCTQNVAAVAGTIADTQRYLLAAHRSTCNRFQMRAVGGGGAATPVDGQNRGGSRWTVQACLTPAGAIQRARWIPGADI